MFAEKLKELRMGKMSQAELARHLGVTQQAVGKWERGIAMPDYRTLVKIADLFVVTTDYLLQEQTILKNYYWRAADLMKMLDCSESKAYKTIAKLNKELEDRGFITSHGRVPRQYVIDRLGLEARGEFA